MLVMAISPLFSPEYISSSLTKFNLLSPQPILLNRRLVTQHSQMVQTSYPTSRDNLTEWIHTINGIVLISKIQQTNPDIQIQIQQRKRLGQMIINHQLLS